MNNSKGIPLREGDELFFAHYVNGKLAVFGQQSLKYKPDLDKNIYGKITTSVIYPVSKNLSHFMPLDLFPACHEDNPALNVVDDPEEGLKLLYPEGEKAIKLLCCSVLGIRQSEYIEENTTILHTSAVEQINTAAVKHSDDSITIVPYGVFENTFCEIVKDKWDGRTFSEEYLRKGDICQVKVLTLSQKKEDPKDVKFDLYARYDRLKSHKTRMQRLREWWYSKTKKDLHSKRVASTYAAHEPFLIPADCVRFVKIEDTTETKK